MTTSAGFPHLCVPAAAIPSTVAPIRTASAGASRSSTPGTKATESGSLPAALRTEKLPRYARGSHAGIPNHRLASRCVRQVTAHRRNQLEQKSRLKRTPILRDLPRIRGGEKLICCSVRQNQPGCEERRSSGDLRAAPIRPVPRVRPCPVGKEPPSRSCLGICS